VIPVIKDFCTYVIGNVLLRGISALLTPFILQAIAPSDYGTLALITSIIMLLTPIAGLGLRQVLSLEYFHHTPQTRAQLITHLIGVYLLCTTPFFILLFALQTPLQQLCGYTPCNTLLLSSALIIAFLYFFVELLYQILRYEQRSLLLTGIQIGSALIYACCTLIFLYALQWGIASILLAQLITALLGTSIGIAYYYITLHPHATRVTLTGHTIKTLLIYGLPFIPNTLFAWFLASGDRWMLAYYATLHDVGIYALADMACQLFQLLILNAWAGSYLPYMLKKYTQDATQLISTEQTNLKYMFLCMIGCIGCIISGYYIGISYVLWLLPPAYHAALKPAFILLLGQVFLLGSYFAATFIQFHKKRLFLSVGLCIPVCINIILNYCWIPLFGLRGCTYATLCAYCIYFIITLCYNLFLQKQILKRSTYEAHNTLSIPATRVYERHAKRKTNKEQELA